MYTDIADSMAERDIFFAGVCSGEKDLFSFEHNGERIFSSQLPFHESCAIGTKRVFVWHLAETGADLELHIFCDDTLPYLEYECFFCNPGKENSGSIKDFHALEFAVPVSEYYESADHSIASRRVNMIYYLGSSCRSDDFQRREKVLTERVFENHLTLGSPHSGRSSENHMPFFRADLNGFDGFDFGIGWSGSWLAEAELKAHTLRIHSGMAQSDFYLRPGERLRAPGAFIGFRKGVASEVFINIHRRYMMKNHAPRNSSGEIILPPVSAVDWGGVKGTEMVTMLDLIKEHKIPVETHWIDAGWMGEDAPCPHFFDPAKGEVRSNWPERVGTLRINRYSHPEGLKVVADHAAEAGMNTLLWFENERVHSNCGEDSLQKHPEWFIPASNQPGFLLLDLGNDEARLHLTRSVVNFMKEHHITHYRQDFNMDPLCIWQSADEPGRRGVREMKHIDGLYRFWSDLREEFPDMFIDNCASGGRRLDYMLGSFSFPLCQSDYGCFRECSYTAIQLQNFFLNEIYPLHSTLSWMPPGDTYAALSSGCGMGVGSKCWNFPSIYPQEDFPFELYRKTLEAILKMRDCMTGNFYALTQNPDERESFCAMQCFNEEVNRGFILVFRHPHGTKKDFSAFLNEIEDDTKYETEEFLQEKSCTDSGKNFRNFRCELPSPRSVRLFFYRKKCQVRS